MTELLVVGVLAGLVAGISPCILPVLPVILVTGGTGPSSGGAPDGRAGGRGRPVAVVAGLVASFSAVILAGSELLSALGLPQGFLRDAGIVVLVVVGLGFVFTPLAALLERPFARVGGRVPTGRGGGFVVGLALGVLFVPCAGPVLAAITVVGATHRVGLTAVLLTVAFAVGAAVPLLAIALAGRGLTGRVRALQRRAGAVRRVSGVVLIVMAVAIGTNTFAGLQRDVPGYTSALQSHLEGGTAVRHKLSTLTGTGHTSLSSCPSGTVGLVSCGSAPAFTGVTTWLNTPGGRPLTLAQLKGKVVLVDFWTYSCINCQRALPHVEAWYRAYRADGLVVVGVHTPEFSFEHVVANVRNQAARLGVRYPVAVDNGYRTWDAYDNEYWPADYLIDAHGDVRHVGFGEGDYAGTERLIRTLLAEARPGVRLPAATEVANRTPQEETSPETYLGYTNLRYLVPDRVVRNAPARYRFPATLPIGGVALSGTWTDHAQEATAGSHAELALHFIAQHVYLVLGGRGTLRVSFDGGRTRTIRVGGVPRLYHLFDSASTRSGTLILHASAGVEAYDFTFG